MRRGVGISVCMRWWRGSEGVGLVRGRCGAGLFGFAGVGLPVPSGWFGLFGVVVGCWCCRVCG